MKISATFTLAILIGTLSYPQTTRAASVSLSPITGLGRLHGLNKGTVAVGYTIGGDEPDGLIYDHGTVTKVTIKNAISVKIYGIENNNRAVGSYHEIDPVSHAAIGKTHGFIYFHGGVTDTIDYPGANITEALGINDPQRVVGYYKDTTSTPHDHGFFFDKKSYTTIDVPGAVDTRLLGLNNPGDMVGYYTDSNDQKHGFLYSKSGAITTIDAQIPGVTVTDTICEAINSSGTIVGEYIDDQGKCHGFVYLAGVFVPVDAPGTPGAVGTFIEGINDNGEVTAFSTIAFLGTAQ